MVLGHHLDAALALLHVNRTFDFCTAVVLQPEVNGNCHVKLLFLEIERRGLRQVLPTQRRSG
ncbi:hypothetical protein D3C79_1096000 [compost metagenome]